MNQKGSLRNQGDQVTKKKQVFIIQIGVTKSGNPRCKAYCSEASFMKAVKDLHRILRSEDPKNWSPNWRDLLKDIENGNQTCYEVDSMRYVQPSWPGERPAGIPA